MGVRVLVHSIDKVLSSSPRTAIKKKRIKTNTKISYIIDMGLER